MLYPQIYIPRFQYLEDISSRIESDSTVVYVFYSGNPEVDSAQGNEIYPGYILENGNFSFYTMVDEDYANEHEVWIFSLNETPEYYRGTLPCEIDPCAPGCPPAPEGCGTGGGGNNECSETVDIGDEDPCDNDAPAARVDFPDLSHNKVNFKIEYMRVRNHKESWVAGASEISIKAKLVCHNGRDRGIPGGEPKEYSSDQYSNRLGKLVKKVKRKDIKDINLLTVNYPLQQDWQNEYANQDPVHFVYILFERDVWPAKLNREKRYAPVSPITNEQPPRSFKLYYRSGGENNGWNIPYADFRFTNTLILAASYYYAGSGLVENQDIAFNTVFFY